MKKLSAILIVALLVLSLGSVALAEEADFLPKLFTDIYAPFAARTAPSAYDQVIDLVSEWTISINEGELTTAVTVYENEDKTGDHVTLFWSDDELSNVMYQVSADDYALTTFLGGRNYYSCGQNFKSVKSVEDQAAYLFPGIDPEYTVATKNAYFRSTTWGMTKAEVAKSEPNVLTPSQYPNYAFVNNVKVAGTHKANALYGFNTQGQLFQGMYTFLATHTNKNDYIEDYKSIKDILTKKYGKPYSDETTWKNDQYKDDPQNYGRAVSKGHLIYHCGFSAGDTEITLGLDGDNYEISHVLLYSCYRLEDETSIDDSGL